MRELEPVVHPSIDTGRAPRAGDRVRFPLTRTAFVVSIGVHVLAAYALSRQVWPERDAATDPDRRVFHVRDSAAARARRRTSARAGGAAARRSASGPSLSLHRRGRPSRSRSRPRSSSAERGAATRGAAAAGADHRLRRGAAARRRRDRHGAQRREGVPDVFDRRRRRAAARRGARAGAQHLRSGPALARADRGTTGSAANGFRAHA